MKRSRPPQIIDPPRRRHRLLSEDERVLWEGVAKQVKPLRKRTRIIKPDPVVIEASPPPALPMSRKVMDVPSAKPVKHVAPPMPPLTLLGRRERSQLSRGRKEIDARLDLHGMTQERAHRALATFLQRASYDGMSFVLIITGKGRSGSLESERGILRRQVPIWLGLPEFRALVVGFEEAHIGHGGAGALYVRVRRAR
ncbi:Smr/MutS family protein [Tardiphaga sp.]|jgi:DNA-nicking Smr family endonuclease|uniref:Smr/MutS family protein n=1 Tax=Tardiphaga sp. TaxID=1926292 RepID=UPI0037DA163F